MCRIQNEQIGKTYYIYEFLTFQKDVIELKKDKISTSMEKVSFKRPNFSIFTQIMNEIDQCHRSILDINYIKH